jgi:hypothetical protein
MTTPPLWKTEKRYPILKVSHGGTVDPTATRQTGPHLRNLLRVEMVQESRLLLAIMTTLLLLKMTAKRYPILKASNGGTVDPTATRKSGPLRDPLQVEMVRELRQAEMV